jgi:hypothetical protein
MDGQYRRFARMAFALIVLALALALASCGQTTTPSSGQSSMESNQTPTATSTVSQTGATVTPGANPPPTSGSVTLTLDQQRYTADSLIIVTIHNGTQHAIWAMDHQTSCTVLVLERQSQGSWYRVGQCALATPTRPVSIQPGGSLVQRISSYQEMNTGAGWQTGSYRATLTYHVGDDTTALTGGGIIHSSTFTIG